MLDFKKSYRDKIAIIEEFLTPDVRAENEETFQAILAVINLYNQTVDLHVKNKIKMFQLKSLDQLLATVLLHREYSGVKSNAEELRSLFQRLELTNAFLVENLYNYAHLIYRDDLDQASWNTLELILDRALWLIDSNKFALKSSPKDTAEVDMDSIMRAVDELKKPTDKSPTSMRHLTCMLIAALDQHHTTKLTINLGAHTYLLDLIALAFMPKNVHTLELSVAADSDYDKLSIYLTHLLDLHPKITRFNSNLSFLELGKRLKLDLIKQLVCVGMYDKVRDIVCADIPVPTTPKDLDTYRDLRNYVEWALRVEILTQTERCAASKEEVARLKKEIEQLKTAANPEIENKKSSYSPRAIGGRT